jgi:hypothetical protein
MGEMDPVAAFRDRWILKKQPAKAGSRGKEVPMRLQQWKANGLTLQAFQLRSSGHYALHPVEAALQYHGASAEGSGPACNASVGFEQAEGVYRAGSQGLHLSEIPQLPQQLRELSRLSAVDRAGRKALRSWAADVSFTIDEVDFLNRWEARGRPDGAEHQVYHDKDSNRWFKRQFVLRSPKGQRMGPP